MISDIHCLHVINKYVGKSNPGVKLPAVITEKQYFY
jgi:hypothetical protein